MAILEGNDERRFNGLQQIRVFKIQCKHRDLYQLLPPNERCAERKVQEKCQMEDPSGFFLGGPPD